MFWFRTCAQLYDILKNPSFPVITPLSLSLSLSPNPYHDNLFMRLVTVELSTVRRCIGPRDLLGYKSSPSNPHPFLPPFPPAQNQILGFVSKWHRTPPTPHTHHTQAEPSGKGRTAGGLNATTLPHSTVHSVRCRERKKRHHGSKEGDKWFCEQHRGIQVVLWTAQRDTSGLVNSAEGYKRFSEQRRGIQAV